MNAREYRLQRNEARQQAIVAQGVVAVLRGGLHELAVNTSDDWARNKAKWLLNAVVKDKDEGATSV